MKKTSTVYQTSTNASTTNTGAGPWVCLIIRHRDLYEPIRVVNNTEAVWVPPHRYQALRFDLQLPNDKKEQQPRAALTVDNVGRELTQWLELSNGGEGAECTVVVVRPTGIRDSAPIPCEREWEVTLNLSNVTADTVSITAELSFEDLLNLPAVATQYRPDSAPGVF